MIWIHGKFRFELPLGSTQIRLLKRQNSKIGMSISSLRIDSRDHLHPWDGRSAVARATQLPHSYCRSQAGRRQLLRAVRHRSGQALALFHMTARPLHRCLRLRAASLAASALVQNPGAFGEEPTSAKAYFSSPRWTTLTASRICLVTDESDEWPEFCALDGSTAENRHAAMKTQRLTLLTELLRIKIETCTGSFGLLTDLHGPFEDPYLQLTTVVLAPCSLISGSLLDHPK
jgi:hypothetical protein